MGCVLDAGLDSVACSQDNKDVARSRHPRAPIDCGRLPALPHGKILALELTLISGQRGHAGIIDDSSQLLPMGGLCVPSGLLTDAILRYKVCRM